MDDAVEALLRHAHLTAAHELPDLARQHVGSFGGRDVHCYLADLQQTVLVPFPGEDGPAAGQHLEPIPMDSTLAGRAFQRVQVLVQRGESGGSTVWLPLLDGTDRVGVMAVGVDESGDVVDGRRGSQLRCFAALIAELIVTKTMYSDTIVRLRRQAPMGLAAEMQWSLLPPLTFASREVTVAAALEPAYEVAGDAIDYAVDAGTARIAVLDGMGHGLTSARLVALAVAAYRHARRASRPLVETCHEVDRMVAENFGGASFTTAIFAELDTKTGVLEWVNAGHPEPLLLRHGRVVKRLHVAPRPPLGLDLTALGVPTELSVGREQLEPGDSVVLFTDGVVDARAPDGEFFGEERLADLLVSSLAAGLPAPETMRHVVRALLTHQQGRLTDDASMLLVQWPTAEPDTLLP